MIMPNNESIFNNHLAKFHNIHKDETAILFATGPSIERFKIFDDYENILKIGVNKIYNYPYINDLDYYFFGSHYYIESEHKQKVDLLSPDLVKFSSVYRDGQETGLGNINKEDSDKLNCIHFECCLDNFTKDPSIEKMLGHTIVFPAIQMLLYMGIKKLYIVGCDLTDHDPELPYWWSIFKTWSEENYPNVEIIIMNPVGLKSIFKDYEQD